MAAYKKESDIAIGNVVGSNIFNIFWILGVSALITPLKSQPAINIDICMAIFASLLLFACLFIGARHRLKRWQGICFLIIYAAYITFLIIKG
jgi:cation:H+ antiporter